MQIGSGAPGFNQRGSAKKRGGVIARDGAEVMEPLITEKTGYMRGEISKEARNICVGPPMSNPGR